MPDDAAKGIVWTSIVQHVDELGWDDSWITVADLNREMLSRHPWSLTGGGAIDLRQKLEIGTSILESKVESIGFSAITGNDDVFVTESRVPSSWSRAGLPVRPIVEGEKVRDFAILPPALAGFPYLDGKAIDDRVGEASFWPWRTILRAGLAFGQTREEKGLHWWEYTLPNVKRLAANRLIAFAGVATHNHFTLDRGGKVFKQSAPVIKLPDDATEEDHLALVGLLNSSSACFWLKQKSYAKTGADNNSGGGNRWSPEPWYTFYDFTSAVVKNYPLPSAYPSDRGHLLDELAQKFMANEPAQFCAAQIPSREALTHAQKESKHIRARMIATQEEIDWESYRLYGLIDEDLTYNDDPPEVDLGERAFELALARSGEKTTWFERHGSMAISEIPIRWPTTYRELVQRRLEAITDNPFIRLLEKPEYKRRWSLEPWEKRQEQALRGWLLDRLEDQRFWFDASGNAISKSVGQLADEVTRDPDMLSVLSLWEGRPDVPVGESLEKLLSDEAVPFLATYRYKDSGLRKREVWAETWDLQRREDRGEKVGMIQVPPTYTSADFRRPSYWRARGKLDVPKERLILYPDANRQGDPTTLLGWAGWDYAEQSLVLSRIIGEREQEGWDDERLVPLVAGLAELQPWVEQWHSDVDERYGVSLAAFCQEQLDQRAAQVGMTRVQLADWRPAPSGRGRKPRAKGGQQ